ncbi:CC/Se motif family (seleno)protein [Neobacillus novalis]|uniref:CC/Se motif family (Seleno)protein n=1 Tax=Neobacillus novalis TaxID=220687 RepID=A0AA95MRS9_9BACI|nr:CC/Se motif family (seleno)protein [Neobacillus novalis]WHY86798.1 CC/Se motif family (seleno)protein [Neobacillus novalis]
MNIELDAGSKEWIESKGNQLTVKTLEVKACCAPGVQELVAVPEKPKTLNNYHEILIDNLSIYVQKNIRSKEKLQLKLSGFSFLKSISAKLQ